MRTDTSQTTIDQLELPPGRKLVDYPDLDLPDGGLFKPRAATTRNGQPETVICAIANADLDRGLTKDITAARQVLGVRLIIHLRPMAGCALIGRRNQTAFRYQFTSDDLDLGAFRLSMRVLCDLYEMPATSGWSDIPLSGLALPQFADLDSFLAWWDLYPGKEKFELHDGQVRLLTRSAAALRSNLLMGLEKCLPDSHVALSGILVRVTDRTAICPDIAIGPMAPSDPSFLSATAAILIGQDAENDPDLSERRTALESRGVKVIVAEAEKAISSNWTVDTLQVEALLQEVLSLI